MRLKEKQYMPVQTVISKPRANLPIKAWLSAEELEDQSLAVEQAINLANHPLAEKWVGLMPDAHGGYGAPIGSVFATRGGVIPYAIGLDIGCGMAAVETSLEAERLDRDLLERIRQAIHARVPVGTEHHKDAPLGLDDMRDPAGPITRQHLDRGRYSLGTLGGGNHFIEIQRHETTGMVWLMIHSGSRNMGKFVCDHYHGEAKKLNAMFFSQLPSAELAFLPRGIPLYNAYLEEMEWCLRFAEDSRLEMYNATVAAFFECGVRLDRRIEQYIETHHNFAAMEHHFGRNYLVHRKGAVKATGLVTVPGSMGTASYICEGLNPAESFNTCAHGAGRLLARRQANRTISHERAVESMAHVVYGVRDGQYDEMPDCYKPIDRVLENMSDLVRPLHKLLPMAVVKG